MRRRSATRRSRIALTTRIPVSQAGGIEASVREIAPRIAALRPGYDVRVVNAFARISALNRLPFVGDVLAAVVLAIKTRSFDVVLVNGGEYAWPRMLRRRDRARTIVVWHGTRAGEIPALVPAMSLPVKAYYHVEKWLQRWALYACGQIAVSATTAKELASSYARGIGIRVVPNGAPAFESGAGSGSPSGHRIAWIGTHAFKKGLDIALAACERTRTTYADLELIVIGIPGERTAAPNGVTYCGRLDHAASIGRLRSADVLLATSRYEGCSVAIIEALSLGVPIVAGPSVAWMVGDAGVAVESFAPEPYAEALAALLGAPSVLHALSQAGPVRARSFDWNVAANAYVAEIERCLVAS